MSNCGRRSLNVAAYVQNLNAIEDATTADSYISQPDDLSLWTDTTFFDFDMGDHVAHDPTARQVHKPILSEEPTAPASIIDPNLNEGGDLNFLSADLKEFGNGFDYNPQFLRFTESAELQTSRPTVSNSTIACSPEPNQQGISRSTSAAPGTAGFSGTITSPQPSTLPTAITQTPSAIPQSAKRKASVVTEVESPNSLEEASRLAAEEDKRRRNTAASARFRVKKKQKEQQLEKTARDMTQRVGQLEDRIQVLEMENKWLKNLIVEKNGGKSGEEIMMPPLILSGCKNGVGIVKTEK